MAESKAVSVRGIDPEVYRWLKVRAAQHDRSMEAEIRSIFDEVRHHDENERVGSLGEWFDSMKRQFGPAEEIQMPTRSGSPARAADFGE